MLSGYWAWICLGSCCQGSPAQMFSWWPVEPKDRSTFLSPLCTLVLLEVLSLWPIWLQSPESGNFLGLCYVYVVRVPRQGDSVPKIAVIDVAQAHRYLFLLCDNYGFVMWPFWKRSSFVFQPQSHFPVSLSLFSLQLAGSWVVPWWFTSSSPDRSKWPVSYPPLLALVCTATL